MSLDTARTSAGATLSLVIVSRRIVPNLLAGRLLPDHKTHRLLLPFLIPIYDVASLYNR